MPKADINAGVAVLVRKATGGGAVKGESLLGDPKLRKAYLAAKKKVSKKKSSG